MRNSWLISIYWDEKKNQSPDRSLFPQLFNTVQEKAVEEQMAAAKEVEMEPTLKSLNEDLVIITLTGLQIPGLRTQRIVHPL